MFSDQGWSSHAFGAIKFFAHILLLEDRSLRHHRNLLLHARCQFWRWFLEVIIYCHSSRQITDCLGGLPVYLVKFLCDVITQVLHSDQTVVLTHILSIFYNLWATAVTNDWSVIFHRCLLDFGWATELAFFWAAIIVHQFGLSHL